MHRTLITLTAALSLTLPMQSCVVAAAGLGAAYYWATDATGHAEATPQEVIAAAEAVMADMDLVVEESRASDLDGALMAHTATDDRVNVKVESKVEGQSKIVVRVGLTDEDAAERILQEILAKLAS